VPEERGAYVGGAEHGHQSCGEGMDGLERQQHIGDNILWGRAGVCAGAHGRRDAKERDDCVDCAGGQGARLDERLHCGVFRRQGEEGAAWRHVNTRHFWF